jgi:MFS family permease
VGAPISRDTRASLSAFVSAGTSATSGATLMSAVTRPRIFRGWYVVAALFTGGFALYGVGLYSFILFAAPLAQEFHWSHAATGGLVSAFWLSAPLSLLAEPLIRRFGSRRLVCAGIVIEAVCLMCLFMTTQLWEMYLLRALAGLGKVLYAINMPIIVSRWFSRRFGVALSVMYSGWHVGGLVLAPVANYLLHSFGWRTAAVILGAGLLLIALPPNLWATQVACPADLGLGLDGDALPPPRSSEQAQAIEHPEAVARYSSALGGLIRLRQFRLIIAATIIFNTTNTGILVHQAAVVGASGVSLGASSLLLGATAGFAAIGAWALGYLVDRYPLTFTAIVEHALMASGVFCLLTITHVQSASLFAMHAVTFGLAVGGSDVFLVTMLKRRTPLNLFQQAWGIWYFLVLVVMVIAPILSGWLYDMSGSYVLVLSLALALVLISVTLCLLVSLGGERQLSPYASSAASGHPTS